MFGSVALVYTEEEAVSEAKRCLQCKEPLCLNGCPVEIDIPAFIKFIAQGDFKVAIDKIKEKNNLPAICGRVCPQETQCEGVCILKKSDQPIAIGYLERFVADWEIENRTPYIAYHTSAKKDFKVAVVGSGPAGLTSAADLAKMGYAVVIFESLHIPGGVLTYGIPEFRLPEKIVEYEIA